MRLDVLPSILLNVNPTLAQLRTALANATSEMSATDWVRHAPGKWNSAEILEHLNRTYMGTIKGCERCLASGKPIASGDRASKRWQRLVTVGLGFFPSGRKSPERALPRGMQAELVASEIFQNIARMDEVISECDSRFGSTTPLADHPALGPLTAREWRKFHLVHGKHHARQIVRLRRQSD